MSALSCFILVVFTLVVNFIFSRRDETICWRERFKSIYLVYWNYKHWLDEKHSGGGKAACDGKAGGNVNRCETWETDELTSLMHETHECNQNDTNRFISLNRLKNSALFIFGILLGILLSNCQYVKLYTGNFLVPGITKFSIHLVFIEEKYGWDDLKISWNLEVMRKLEIISSSLGGRIQKRILKKQFGNYGKSLFFAGCFNWSFQMQRKDLETSKYYRMIT